MFVRSMLERPVFTSISLHQAYLEYEPVSGNIKLDLAGSTPSINLLEVRNKDCSDSRCVTGKLRMYSGSKYCVGFKG